MIEKIFENMKKFSSKEALCYKDQVSHYEDLLEIIEYKKGSLKVRPGEVVYLIGDFDLETLSSFFALIALKAIIVPLQRGVSEEKLATLKGILPEGMQSQHEFLTKLREDSSPGLVIFSSGTSGTPKAAVHNFDKLLKKFTRPGKSVRSINFLLFDHWGGLNTALHLLSSGGFLVAPEKRSPGEVCRLIEKYKLTLLPTSPSFLNLLLMSGEAQKYDLSSLTHITYGTEPMPETTLKKCLKIFPHVKFHQTYGLIELGVMKSQSKDKGSLWVKLSGDGYKFRVREGMLEVKADSAMLGYLNAPSPFTEDGWFKTNDMVEVDGDFLLIKGRQSELINVGGEKVYPQEVENVILECPDVLDVTVFKESNKLLGHIVCAQVYTQKMAEEYKSLSSQIKKHCRGKLDSFKVPVKITFTHMPNVSERQKKQRANFL